MTIYLSNMQQKRPMRKCQNYPSSLRVCLTLSCNITMNINSLFKFAKGHFWCPQKKVCKISTNGFNDDLKSRVVHQKGYLTNPIVIFCPQLWKSHQHSELHKMHCLCCKKSCLILLYKNMNSVLRCKTPYPERVHTSVCFLDTRNPTKRVLFKRK